MKRFLQSLPLLLLVLASTAHGWAGPDGRFIENRGQLPDPVKYYAYCGEATLYFTETGVIIDLPMRAHAGRMRFVDARPPSALEPREPQPTRLNYYTGNDPRLWKSDLRVFSELVYRDLWPGVDLLLQAKEGEVRYRILAPAGAELKSGRWEQRFAFEGFDRITTTVAGATELELPGGHLTDVALSSDGTDRVLRWGTETGKPEESMAGGKDFVRDDPSTLAWSTFMGGSDNDYGHGLTVDSSGQPVVVGYTRSPNFPTTIGAYDRTQNGGYDLFVAKLDATGSTLLWATFVGGSLEDRPFDVAVDAADAVFVTGQTYSSDFPTTPNAFSRALGGPRDTYVAKLSDAGGTLEWSTYLGGSSYERAWSLALDSSGRPVVAGETSSTDYPTTAGAYDTVLGGIWDACVTKLDAQGQTLVWSTFLGGASSDWIHAVVMDHLDCPVVAGDTYSSDYPTTPGAYDRTANGSGDAFLTKLDPQGSSLVLSSFLGGSGLDGAFGVALNSAGQPVVAGSTTSLDFPVTPGAYDVSYNGAGDIYVAQLNTGGTTLLWNTYIGGSDIEESFAMIVDPQGRAIVTGETSSTDYPTTASGIDRSYAGNRDAFITQVSPRGDAVLWSTYLGGIEYDSGWDFALDSAGITYLTGPTRSPEFPTTTGVYDRSYNGGEEDVYVVRLAIPPIVAAAPSDEPNHTPNTILRAGPNPFHESLQLRLDLPRPSTVSLLVLDATGRRVATLASGLRLSGTNSLVWSGRDAQNRLLDSGVYWLRLEAGSETEQTKVICVR